MDIKLVKHRDIDIKKWDQAIKESVNGLVYASSWYLNIVNPGWEALVGDDYKIVMPITFRKKYGVKYVYKPFFSQFLGAFYIEEEYSKYVQSFIEEASKHFKYISMNLNVINSCFEANYTTNGQTQKLLLNKKYHVLKNEYKKSNKINIKKANEENLRIEKSGNFEPLISMIKSMYKDRKVKGVTEKDFSELEKIVDYSIKNGIGEIHYAYHINEICAAAYFLKWGNRIIIQTGINEIGKKSRAIFKIIDDFIKKNADQDLLFDFAGSNIPGVKYRNLGFGAKNEIYYRLKINNLPPPFKWLKK